MRQAKLVCTIGPASRNRIAELVEAGMDVARLNFSHGRVAEHLDALAEVRAASEASGRQLAVMGDLPGPKVRLGQLAGGEVELSAGQTVRLASGPDGEADGDGAGLALPVSYPRLGADVAVGDPLLLADGAAELRVIAARPEEVTAEVVRGGSIRSGAGLNVPSERLGLPAVTDRDRAALTQMLEAGVDFVAQSFVRRAEDLHELRRMMGDRAVPIVAKIETRAALANFGELLSEADAVMLARGDLGVELPYAEVPVVQKRLIADCVRAGVPVIVATQMLESMVHAPRPTRAEASDVANAVLDGADAVMLSAETAIGEHPLEAARAAAQIVVTAEQAGLDGAPVVDVGPAETEAGTIAAAAVDASRRAADPPISGIACFTRSGLTARLLAARRPPCPIHALSPDPAILRRLALWRGVIPIAAGSPNDTDAMIRLADEALRGAGVPDGAWVVIVGSIPFGAARTNFLKLHRLGSVS